MKLDAAQEVPQISNLIKSF